MAGKIRVGIVGIGNCFAGLWQGLEYYKRNPSKKVAGLMHDTLGGYSWKDIEFVSAFDVAKNKVGKPLHEAGNAPPNMVDWIKDMPKSDCIVRESPVLDGVGYFVKEKIDPITNKPMEQLRKEILDEIRKTKTEVIVSYLPVGSQKATEFWAEVSLETGCAFVNCVPVFIASDPAWEKRFREKGIPIIGDDIKAQVGATIVHRTLAKLCDDRGTKIERSYQLNVGGNTDFQNMKELTRLTSKKISKTESVQSQLRERLSDNNIHIGPSDYVPFLENTKVMYMRIEGLMWADRPYNMEVRLQVDDKANSAGISVDAIRCAKLALDRKQGGAVTAASAYLMKHPPMEMSDPDARKRLEDFISGKD
jgi:myo-inositol-1-phosphate synthase